MLQQINIINFALIENLTISFDRGLNILTGETGAGKSILIDAINYVLGGKFNKELIRTGENRTFVEAIFLIENFKTKEVLRNLDIEFDDMVIISRETFQSGKSVAKINGKALILSQIKQISETLIDIHGQHENQNLLDSSTHIQYLDYFGENEYGTLLYIYAENYKKLSEINFKINEIQGNEGEREKLLDFLKYQLEEISNAGLKENEDSELEKQYRIISNFEKINNVLGSAYEILYNGSEDVSSIFDSIGSVIKELRSIERHVDVIKKVSDSLEEAYYSIEENIEQIRKTKEDSYYDEAELQFINQRLYVINNLKKKYGESIEDIMQYKNKISIQYDELVNSEKTINNLLLEKSELELLMNENAIKIHAARLTVAEDLEKKIKNELNYVGLEKSILKIEVLEMKTFFNNGFDRVQFCISTNLGEPVKPLERIVSGGELSRVMLALKTVFVDKDKIPSIIFDEIDTGISGRIAQCVGEKMFAISSKHQVFCITHLPQIACMSDVHYLISKYVKDNKTYTEVHPTTNKEKELEIARMIGGAEVTKLTLENSKELIKIAHQKKMDLKA
ncbi:MAG: DNA repair protein RecN [Clostridiaceae bacterium]|nr:DNA repair protein RecN [Clostridiaceae bacterium]